MQHFYKYQQDMLAMSKKGIKKSPYARPRQTSRY